MSKRGSESHHVIQHSATNTQFLALLIVLGMLAGAGAALGLIILLVLL
jgi:hypothetical protein